MVFDVKKILKELTVETWIELIAVFLNLSYTFFYLNNNKICFPLGIAGALLMARLYLKNRLYAETGLQFFYAILSVYGWMMPTQWESTEHALNHYFIGAIAIVFVGLLGMFIKKFRQASLPYADSFMTITAIIGSILMILYVDKSWLYLLASNVVAIMICISKRMYLATMMYLVYIIMAIDGYWNLSIFQ